VFAEDALLPISALQHLLFCERQCALIHIEGLWAENRLTAEGRLMHRKAHEGPDEWKGDVRIARGLALRSLRLGLVGYADIVEFHPSAVGGAWNRPRPVEYKRGRPKQHRADEVQLCAQALCLEEMLDTQVPDGALFYGQTKRRQQVTFDAELRQTTEEAAARLHALIANGRTPRARREPKCDACSLIEVCMPAASGDSRSARSYFDEALARTLERDDADAAE